MISKIAAVLLVAVATILFLHVPTIHCHNTSTTCSEFCTIAVVNDSHIIKEMKNNKKQVFYLILKAEDNSQLFNRTDNTLFALIGLNSGRRFMVMPYDIHLLSVFLSDAFVANDDLRINQYPDHCYIHLSANQRDQCTFRLLKRLHRQAVNCTGKACGTFCRRQINSFKSLDDTRVICCPMVKDDEICNIEDLAPPFLIVFRYLSLFFSFILSIYALNWFNKDVPTDRR